MATFSTTFSTDQDETTTKRDKNPSYRDVQSDLKYARIEYTFAGTEVTTDIINLGSLGIEGAKVVPELSRLRDTGGAQDIDVSMKLNALVGTTSTDLSGVVAFDNASIAFTEIAGTDLVALGATDKVRLIISDGAIGAVTAGETLVAEIAYIAPSAS